MTGEVDIIDWTIVAYGAEEAQWKAREGQAESAGLGTQRWLEWPEDIGLWQVVVGGIKKRVRKGVSL